MVSTVLLFCSETHDLFISRDCNKVFRAQSKKEKSASSSYSKALKKMLSSIAGAAKTLQEFSIRDGHFNTHGMRKGAGTHVTTEIGRAHV